MQLAGRLAFLTTHVFYKMARGGLQPMYSRLAENISPDGRLDRFCPITASLAMGLDLFFVGLGLLKPRIHSLASLDGHPVVIYSDAEWTSSTRNRG